MQPTSIANPSHLVFIRVLFDKGINKGRCSCYNSHVLIVQKVDDP